MDEHSTAPSPAANLPARPAFDFDPAEFMEFVRDEDLTEREAEELLREYWQIVVALVRLESGLTLDLAALDNSAAAPKRSARRKRDVVSFREQFSTATKTKTAPRRNRRVR